MSHLYGIDGYRLLKGSHIISLLCIFQVETIRDAYMVVSGLPNRNGVRHAREISEMSLNFMEALREFTIRHMPLRQLTIRVGIHCGSCCAGKFWTRCCVALSIHSTGQLTSRSLLFWVRGLPLLYSLTCFIYGLLILWYWSFLYIHVYHLLHALWYIYYNITYIVFYTWLLGWYPGL